MRSVPCAVRPAYSSRGLLSAQSWQTTVKAVVRARRTTVCSYMAKAALALPSSVRTGAARAYV